VSLDTLPFILEIEINFVCLIFFSLKIIKLFSKKEELINFAAP